MFNLYSEIFTNSVEARLSLEDERAAIAASQAGDSAATSSLLLAYAPALRAGVAWHRRAGGLSSGVDLDDVRQSAVWGLLEAIQEFDLSGPYERLAATVHGRVHWAVSEALGGAQQISIPERTRRRFFAILRAAGGDFAVAAELAPQHSMSAETFRAIADAVSSAEPEFDSLVDLSAEGAFDDAEAKILVEVAFAAVTPTEATVCRMAYGFAHYDVLPDAEIAHQLGASRSAVQRTRSASLTKMRAALLPSID